MSKICVCIEGQLRGAKRCGPTIKKYLIDRYNADLFFCIQNYVEHDSSNIELYGKNKGVFLYDNPEPSFKHIFNKVCKEYAIDPKWEQTFDQVPSRNYTLGYATNGTCMRRMYNRFLFYNIIRHYDYDWFVVTRSDYYMVMDFHDVTKFDKSAVHCFPLCSWGGENNNLIVFHKSQLKPVMTYIFNLLNGSFLEKYLSIPNRSSLIMNEEKFFQLNMNINNVLIRHMENICYMSADRVDGYTTYGAIKQAPNGDIYKYDDYHHTMKLLQTKDKVESKDNVDKIAVSPVTKEATQTIITSNMEDLALKYALPISKDKHQYIPFYEKFIPELMKKGERIQLLMISRQKQIDTAYHRFWTEYFDNKVDILCVEENPYATRYNNIYKHIKWINSLDELPNKKFHLVIDTKEDFPNVQQMTFKRCWNYIASEGMYIIEYMRTVSHEHGISSKALFESWANKKPIYSSIINGGEMQGILSQTKHLCLAPSSYTEWSSSEREHALFIITKK